MTATPFALSLVQKSKRALRTARLDLQDGDPDGAVNRSYYAMFDIARAALLSSGIPEHKLPRTHSGVIAAFGRRAVQSGAIDAELARSLSRTEGLRLRADYTGTQIDPKKAADTVAEAEAFVATVERTFELGAPHLEADRDHDKPKGGDTVSEPDVGVQQWKANYPHPNPFSLEDEQRQARENWLRLRQQATNAEVKIDKERAAGQAAENDRGYSASLDFDD